MAGLSSALILKALDCLSVRQDVIAENIANANTAGYRPKHVSFELALKNAAGQGVDAVREVAPRIETDVASTDGVRLDQQLTAASATALRYSALVEILARQSQRDALLISGGG